MTVLKFITTAENVFFYSWKESMYTKKNFQDIKRLETNYSRRSEIFQKLSVFKIMWNRLKFKLMKCTKSSHQNSYVRYLAKTEKSQKISQITNGIIIRHIVF